MADGATSFADGLFGDRKAHIPSLFNDVAVEMQCAYMCAEGREAIFKRLSDAGKSTKESTPSDTTNGSIHMADGLGFKAIDSNTLHYGLAKVADKMIKYVIAPALKCQSHVSFAEEMNQENGHVSEAILRIVPSSDPKQCMGSEARTTVDQFYSSCFILEMYFVRLYVAPVILRYLLLCKVLCKDSEKSVTAILVRPE
ncbi:hypothetical protein RHGRI_026339 [Rhododendron griersonianum]|uniref:Uncharacterized protein n=1 Tax=Rhododendron griersonianum TaxID=479676 RepID=A0AAV6ISJ9_9ERIC|nr:hypothetical protein RHGRI_026339 [Rhododendron griersonianum]